jgi:hypothetical protein
MKVVNAQVALGKLTMRLALLSWGGKSVNMPKDCAGISYCWWQQCNQRVPGLKPTWLRCVGFNTFACPHVALGQCQS